MIQRLTASLALILFGSSASWAGPMLSSSVYGTPAALTGLRTESQFVTGGDWAADSLTQQIAWVITNNGNGTWDYLYTFTNFVSPAMSHWILDLSDDAVIPTVDPHAVTNVVPNFPLVFGTFGPAPSNPGFPTGTSIVGVKFDNLNDPGSPFTIKFTSNRSPVWGDWYAKGGRDSFAYNAGLTDHDSTNVNDFIARPDSASPPPVPEPSTLALAGLAGLGLAGWSRCRRARS